MLGDTMDIEVEPGKSQEVIMTYGLKDKTTVDTNAVTMEADGESLNAFVPLTIVNSEGFDLPKTGDNGTMLFTACGVILMFTAAVVVFLLFKKPKKASSDARKK